MLVKISENRYVCRILKLDLVVASMLLSLFLVSGCSTKPPIVPTVSQDSTGERLVGKFIWYDLFVDDLGEVIPFYEGLFGWSFVNTEPNRDRVKTIYRNGTPIGNAVGDARGKKGDNSSHWLGYLSTDNVDETCLVVTQNKGSIHMEPKDLPDRGRVAVMVDPQGAYVALVTSTSGDPIDNDRIQNNWVGSELWTTSIGEALEFYTALFDYDVEMKPMGKDFIYTVLNKNDEERAGIVKIPWEDEIKPIWIPYVAVKDTMDIIAKAQSLGGTILINADPAKQINPNAIIADPQGSVFGVVEIGKEQP